MLQHVLSLQRNKNMDLVSKPRSKSAVWLYFGLKADKKGNPLNSNQVICRLCRKVVLVKGGNTTNLRSHLTRSHREHFHKPFSSFSSPTSALCESKGLEIKSEELFEDPPQVQAAPKDSSFVPDSVLPSGEPWLRGGPSRAVLSLPPCLSLCKDTGSSSSCPGSSGAEQTMELKVYARSHLQQGVMFGPFVGEVCSGQMPTKVKYTWAIRDESAFIYVDAADENKSNWMRYVTYASSEEEHNLMVFQFYRNIYYKVSRPIPEGGELRVSIGKDYASLLGLETGEGVKCKVGDKESALRFLQDIQLITLSESSSTSLQSDRSQSQSPMPVIRDVMTVSNPDTATDTGVISSSTLPSTPQFPLPFPGCNPGEKYHFIPGTERLLSDPTASHHSPWYFFGFVPDQAGRPLDRSTAVCKLCDTQVNCAGGAADLQSHLMNKHHIKPRDGSKDRCLATGQQPTFPLILSSPVTEAIANFLIMDLHPVTLVEGDGFKQLIRSFLPSYNDLTCLLENLLKDHYAKGKTSLGQLLRWKALSSNNEEMYDYTAPIEFESRRQSQASSSQKDIPHYVTLSVDVWLHNWQGNVERYITLWAHLIDSNFSRHNMTLATQRLKHSEVNDFPLLEGQVKAMAETWGISHPNLVLLGVERNILMKPGVIKSENGAESCGNVPHPNSTTSPERDDSASPDGGTPSIPCFFRAAQRCVEDVMSHPVVSETLLQFQRFFSASFLPPGHHQGLYQNHAWRLLQVLTKKEQAGFKSWARSWPTWNDLYFLLSTLLKHRNILCEVAKEMKAEFLSREDSESCSANSTSSSVDVPTLPSEWRLVEDLCLVLKPLDVACRTLAREDFPRLSLVKPILTGLLSRHLVSRPDDYSTVKEVKSTIRKNLASCYGDPTVNRILSVACSLDPQFHGLRFMEEKEQAATFDWLKKEALRVVKEEQRRSQGDKHGQSDRSASPGSPESDGERPRSKRLKKSQPVYKYDDEESDVEEEKESDSQDGLSGMEFLLGDLFCAPPPRSRQSSVEECLDTEISVFRADQRASLGVEPLEWWKTKAAQFPLLSAAARAFLAAPAVAGNAAQSFGDEGATRRKKSNIPPDDLDMILFLHHNHIPTGSTAAWLQDMSGGSENVP